MYKELNIQDHMFMMEIMHDFWKKTLNTKVMQNFLSDPRERFDVVIAEWLYTEIGAGLVWNTYEPTLLNREKDYIKYI